MTNNASNRICWAAVLGDCDDKMSREHIITEGVFSDDRIKVEGMPWCLDEYRDIGLANLTRKVLCKRHNETLTDVDRAGIDAANQILDAKKLREVREKMPPRRWTIQQFPINGLLLERWCTKTLINIAQGQPHNIGLDSEIEGEPSRRLVEIAFGRRQFTGRAGLYGIAFNGLTLRFREGVQIITLIDNKRNHLGAAVFVLHGFPLLFSLDEEGVGPQLELPQLSGLLKAPKNLYQTVYHIKDFKDTIGRYLSTRIRFNWPTVGS